MKKRKIFIIGLVILILGGGTYLLRGQIFPYFFLPQESPEVNEGVSIEEEKKEGNGEQVNGDTSPEEKITVVAENLEIPWEIAFLPDGRMLVTERPGRLTIIGEEKTSIPIPGVRHIGEGGLLGMALHPDFENNRYLYLYMTVTAGRGLENKVERYVFENDSLGEGTVIVGNIPGAQNHNGGRIDFGPDGYLYITTGDAQNTRLSQEINSLAGKILRITDEGGIPEDNPFGNEIYSLGHRNPQGITWDNQGRLWATEHGPSARDELNLIEAGKNYGWPNITGDNTAEGMETPKLHSGTNFTWAPTGIAYLNGKIFFGGLRGQSLFEVNPSGLLGTKAHFREELGRIRIVRKGPDGMLYIGTSNKDGRGFPAGNDDKILRLNPTIFE